MQKDLKAQFDKLKQSEFDSGNDSEYINNVTELIAQLQEHYQSELQFDYFDHISQLFQDQDGVNATLDELSNDDDVSTEAMNDDSGTLYKFVQNGTKNPLNLNEMDEIAVHHNLSVLPVDFVDRKIAFNILRDMVEDNSFE
ncbi:hypothetical protein ACYATP_07940 [Lactobacillaceae bacterium Melli_B4]